MAKKRTREADGDATPSKAPRSKKLDDSDSSDDDDFDVVNVDFEWFNFDADIDFHGVKSLLKQLLDVDAQVFDVSGLADLILSQPTIGSTVKVDEKGNDAFAFLTVLNTAVHKDKKPLTDLVTYMREKASTTEALRAIADLLSKPDAQVGLVLSERLINMPSEISPPMYGMLLDEIEAAVEDGEPYEFAHYLILSKTYHEMQSTIETEGSGPKKKKAKDQAPLFYFHPEDETLLKYASAHGTYPFTRADEATADSKRAFQEMGVESQGSMMLIDAKKFPDAVKAVQDLFAGS